MGCHCSIFSSDKRGTTTPLIGAATIQSRIDPWKDKSFCCGNGIRSSGDHAFIQTRSTMAASISRLNFPEATSFSTCIKKSNVLSITSGDGTTHMSTWLIIGVDNRATITSG